MSERFDDICRVVAMPLSRRHAWRLFLGALAGSAVGPLFPRTAQGGAPAACTNEFNGNQNCGGGKYCGRDPKVLQCCLTLDGKDKCCCADGSRCCSNFCCDTKLACCSNVDYCCPDKVQCCKIKGVATCCAAGESCLNDKECCKTADICHLSDKNKTPICCSGKGCPPDPSGKVTGCCDVALICASQDGKIDVCCRAPDKCLPDKKCCPKPRICEQEKICCESPFVCDPILDVCVEKVNFNTHGAGKEIVPVSLAVTTMRFQITGTWTANGPLGFTADTVTGTLSAFNYATRLLIQSNTFTSFQGTYFDQSGIDFMFTSQAVALANGVPIPIQFNASSVEGVYTFEVLDAGGNFLAGGVGEDGRSALSLSTSAIE